MIYILCKEPGSTFKLIRAYTNEDKANQAYDLLEENDPTGVYYVDEIELVED